MTAVPVIVQKAPAPLVESCKIAAYGRGYKVMFRNVKGWW